MLDWNNLTFRQKSACTLFCLFVLAVLGTQLAESFNSVRSPSLKDALGTLLGVTALLGVILNPQFVRGSLSAFNLSKTPTVCRALFATAFVAFLAMGVVGFIARLA